MPYFPNISRFTVVTGHYGCGKTNLAINLALDLARAGRAPVTLVDLDIVNPYFRSSDHGELLRANGVRLIAPSFAGTTLDAPALPAEIQSAFAAEGPVIFDVGGDDAGATALGRYAADIRGIEHDLLYVVNRYRNLTATPEEAAALLREIEAASHLTATGVVNNSHLQASTTLATVADSLEYGRRTAELLGLPLRFTTVPARLEAEFQAADVDAIYRENAYPVQTYVRAPWDDAAPVAEEV